MLTAILPLLGNRKMIIWKVNDKAEKPTTQSEMDEKFALLFRSEVSLGSEELMVKVQLFIYLSNNSIAV